MDVATLLIQVLSGAVGGNLLARAMPRFDQGAIGNTLAGLVGGGLGSTLSGAGTAAVVVGATYASDLVLVVGTTLAGCAGGAVVTSMIGLLREALPR